ncbi:MAG TPA: L,D-transpeptidase family protein [Terriglobales bacterium]|nr:L,D-transpeptidase family protein [Terriglobales bacterium]
MTRSETLSRNALLSISLVLLAALYGPERDSAKAQTQSVPTSREISLTGPELSAQGREWLSAAINVGTFSDLRWSDFSDYRLHVKRFYGLNQGSLWWVRGMQPTLQAQQMILLFTQAAQKGLTAEDYDALKWNERLAKLRPRAQQADEADAVKFDLALTICAMRYISDLHMGKVNPKRLAFALENTSRLYDLPEFLRDHVVNESDVASALEQVEPPYPGYRRTLRALQTYIQLAGKDDGEQLPPSGKSIVPGDRYAGIPRLARLLRLVGDLSPEVTVTPEQTIYTGVLVDAVKNFQRRHGREPNGTIDTQTLADLNVPLTQRVRQMQLTLERWRWLPEAYRNAPIVVNIPEFRLRAYDQNFNIAVTMNVVVGRALGHNTPVFSEMLQYVIFRPYWEVPPSITRAEIVPHLLRDPGYLAKKDLEVVGPQRNVVAAGAVTSDLLAQLRAGKLALRQKPGPKNSLGLVKFVFPNSYNVYLHDTPATELFAKSRRDFSHGCIRLEKPADLAAWVLRDNSGWTVDRIRAAMDGDLPQQVNLSHPIPVLILYGTVIVLEDGLVRFYDDIYGHDAALQKILDKGYPYPW